LKYIKDKRNQLFKPC